MQKYGHVTRDTGQTRKARLSKIVQLYNAKVLKLTVLSPRHLS